MSRALTYLLMGCDARLSIHTSASCGSHAKRAQPWQCMIQVFAPLGLDAFTPRNQRASH